MTGVWGLRFSKDIYYCITNYIFYISHDEEVHRAVAFQPRELATFILSINIFIGIFAVSVLHQCIPVHSS